MREAWDFDRHLHRHAEIRELSWDAGVLSESHDSRDALKQLRRQPFGFAALIHHRHFGQARRERGRHAAGEEPMGLLDLNRMRPPHSVV
jgi:hypothetical protein